MEKKRLLLFDDEEEYGFQPKRKLLSNTVNYSGNEEDTNEENEVSEDDISEKANEGDKDSEDDVIEKTRECEKYSEDDESEEISEEDDVSEDNIDEKASERNRDSEDDVSEEANEGDKDSEDDVIEQTSNKEKYSEDDSSEEIIKEDEDLEADDSNEEENGAEENYAIKLGKDQEIIYNYVKKMLTDKKFCKENPKIILVEGAAGTGKTELFKAIYDYVHLELGCQAICTASTGVAALNYNEGRTSHSMFGFPYNIQDTTKHCEINDYNQQVSCASVIIFDAVNMTDNRLIEMLNTSLQKLINSSQMFGGKIIIFGADFLELAPIVPNVTNKYPFSIKFSSLLNKDNTKFFTLKDTYRTTKDIDFFYFLLDLGVDNFSPTFHNDMYFVPLYNINYSTCIDKIIDFVYPAQILSDLDLCSKRAILSTTKRNAQEINAKITKNFSETTKIIKSIDIVFENFENYSEELDETSVFPDADLELWKGCLCMVTQNMYQPSRLFYETLLNGTKVIVQNITPDIISVRRPGEKWCIPIERKTFRICEMGKRIMRTQFPLKLCYATTIHRSQGQTLDKVGVDLRESVFCHGQLYLALSRVRHSEDVLVCIENKFHIDGVAYAANIVEHHLVRPVEL